MGNFWWLYEITRVYFFLFLLSHSQTGTQKAQNHQAIKHIFSGWWLTYPSKWMENHSKFHGSSHHQPILLRIASGTVGATAPPETSTPKFDILAVTGLPGRFTLH